MKQRNLYSINRSAGGVLHSQNACLRKGYRKLMPQWRGSKKGSEFIEPKHMDDDDYFEWLQTRPELMFRMMRSAARCVPKKSQSRSVP